MNKLFKKSLFGFNKADVISYITNLSEKTDAKIDELEDKIDELEKANKELTENLNMLNKDKDSISAAILTAEKKAEEIVSEAVKEGLDKKAKTEEELKEAAMKLKKLHEEIRQLKTNIVLSANKYKDELNLLIGDDQ